MSDSDIAISVRGLRKVFKIFPRPSDIMLETLTGRQRHSTFEALENISFDVKKGKSIGIMGRNGAGKSTLLKTITGALEPTEGEVVVDGSVTAILELGTGFHPEYTGRENVYMGAMCLGMSRRQIDEKFDEIVDFAELEKFIDHPFRTYSSGMQARLTFSVALAPDPDILIIDEALSVGDARFQQKCYAHMRKLRDQGKTFLLVSHDDGAIVSFCDEAIILDGGVVHFQGEPNRATWVYQKLLFSNNSEISENPTNELHAIVDNPVSKLRSGEHSGREGDEGSNSNENKLVAKTDNVEDDEQIAKTSADSQIRYGNEHAKITTFGLHDHNNAESKQLFSGKPCSFYFKFTTRQDIEDWSGGFTIRDPRGLVVFGVTTMSQNMKTVRLAAGKEMLCKCDCVMWLASGTYFLTLGLAEQENGQKIDFIENAVVFDVVGPAGIFTTSCVNLDVDFQVVAAESKNNAN